MAWSLHTGSCRSGPNLYAADNLNNARRTRQSTHDAGQAWGAQTISCDCPWTLKGNLRSFNDRYDFNASNHRSTVGEILTGIGKSAPGKDFDIHIKGEKPISEGGEIMRLNRFFINQWIFIFFVLFIFLGGCSSNTAVTEGTAQKIAAINLQKYAERNNIPLTQFGAPEIRFNKDLQVWEIYSQSSEIPKHHVVILVDKFGGAKTTFTVDAVK